mmetsp:Transcript_654/g.971  ORF Transcript_654/g.971 Transcript_654/m.971 type:complete len:297 (+) Transcript_654:2015-2905(+)
MCLRVRNKSNAANNNARATVTERAKCNGVTPSVLVTSNRAPRDNNNLITFKERASVRSVIIGTVRRRDTSLSEISLSLPLAPPTAPALAADPPRTAANNAVSPNASRRCTSALKSSRCDTVLTAPAAQAQCSGDTPSRPLRSTGSALAVMRNTHNPARSASAATCNGVNPSEFCIFKSPPCDNNVVTVRRCPRIAAQCNGVAPSSEAALTRAPLFNNNVANSKRGISQATCKGEQPRASHKLQLAPRFNSSAPIAVASDSTAQCNGVRPSCPRQLALTCAFNNVSTVSTLPANAAK